jgi:hypothetical protein
MGTAEASLLTLEQRSLHASGCELSLPVGRHVLPESYYVAAMLPRSGGLVEQLVKLLGGHADDLARWTEQARDLLPGARDTCLPPQTTIPTRKACCSPPLATRAAPATCCAPCSRGYTPDAQRSSTRDPCH